MNPILFKKQILFVFVLLALILSPIGAATPVSAAGPLPTIALAAWQTGATSSSRVSFRITFSSAIDPASFTASDVTLTVPANGTVGVPTSSDNIVWIVPVLAHVSGGVITISLAATVVASVVGGSNDNLASTTSTPGSTDTVTVTDATGATATITLPAGIQPQNGGSTVDFLVTFNEPVLGLDVTDFSSTSSNNGAVIGACPINLVMPVADNFDPLFATSYLVEMDYWACAPTANGDLIGLALNNTYTDALYNAGTVANGVDLYTVNRSTSVAPTVPGGPFLPAANSLVDTQAPITLKWGVSSQVMSLASAWHYEVQYDDISDFSNGTYPWPVSTAGDPNAVIGLSENTLVIPAGTLNPTFRIYWRVRSVSNRSSMSGTSAWSPTQVFLTRARYPTLFFVDDGFNGGNPLNGPWGNISSHRPAITWAPVSFVSSYTVQIFQNGVLIPGGGTIPAIFSPSFTPTVALPGGAAKIYTFKVKSNNATYPGVFSPMSNSFTTTSPAAPVLIANNNVVSAPQALSWNASLVPVGSVAANCYQWELDSTPAPNQFSGTTIFPTYLGGYTIAPAVSFNTGALRPGQTYYWHVRGYTLGGGTCAVPGATVIYGPWSVTGALKAKYVAPTIISPANTLSLPASNATGVTRTAPIFTWNMGTNGLWTSVTIELATNSIFTTGLKSFIVAAPSQTYAANTLLLGNTTYYWRVRINGLYIGLAPFTNVSAVRNFNTAP